MRGRFVRRRWGGIPVPWMCALVALLFGILAPPSVRAELPAGKSEQVMDVGGVLLTVQVYKPVWTDRPQLLVGFHGSDRKAALVRDFLVPLAERLGAVVIVPLLDAERFPRWAYQWAGVVEPMVVDGEVRRKDGKTRYRVRPEEDWTGRLVPALVARIRAEEGRPDMPFSLIGHSAGAQFLGRMAAFVDIGGQWGARRIVLANPGSYLAPTRKRLFPYGLGGLPKDLRTDDDLRRYLAQPITVYLGTRDHRRRGLDASKGAQRQGATRHERGLTVYAMAEKTARLRGWPFGWRLVEVPGIGHNSRKMYGSPAAEDALAPAPSAQQQVGAGGG